MFSQFMLPVDLIVAAAIFTLVLSFAISVRGLAISAAIAASARIRGEKNAD